LGRLLAVPAFYGDLRRFVKDVAHHADTPSGPVEGPVDQFRPCQQFIRSRFMSAAAQRLEETGNALRNAMAQQDWTAISALDLQCRQVVEAAMAEPLEDEQSLRQQLHELMDLYRELVASCQAEKQRVAGELIQLKQSQQGANVYKLFG
jgi:hypothetical protein